MKKLLIISAAGLLLATSLYLIGLAYMHTILFIGDICKP